MKRVTLMTCLLLISDVVLNLKLRDAVRHSDHILWYIPTVQKSVSANVTFFSKPCSPDSFIVKILT